jgi:predicted dithiol-disulfide oxidoreductase (DUF899 family)
MKGIILFKTLFVKILSYGRKLCNHTNGYIGKNQACCICKKARNTIKGKLDHLEPRDLALNSSNSSDRTS